MALVNQVQKRVKMPKWEVVKFQILTHCYINRITMSESDLNCLTLLSFNEPVELTHFCYDASTEEEWIFKSSQTVRNCINKAESTLYIMSVEDVYCLFGVLENQYKHKKL